jgi:hypothetical protein
MNTAPTAAVCGYLQIVKRYWSQLSDEQQKQFAREIDTRIYVNEQLTAREIQADSFNRSKLSSVGLIERVGIQWGKMGLRTRRDISRRVQQAAQPLLSNCTKMALTSARRKAH